jgi:hypothetical protein
MGKKGKKKTERRIDEREEIG